MKNEYENLEELEREIVDSSDPEEEDDWEEEEDDSEYISEREAEERYEEYLDEVYGEVTIAGMTFGTGYALKELDPIAFRCGMSDWADAEGLEIL